MNETSNSKNLYGMINSHAHLKGVVKVGNINFDNDYEKLDNLPTINGIVVKGDLTLSDFGSVPITDNEIKEIVDDVFSEEL